MYEKLPSILIRCFLPFFLISVILVQPAAGKGLIAPTLLTPTTLVRPIEGHSVSSEALEENISKILVHLSDKPFSSELLAHYFLSGTNVAYWEEEVPSHIKAGIVENVNYQKKLQRVLENAYIYGHYKIDFISDETKPSYREESFNETLYNQTFAFEEGDLASSIHGINGHVVIDATYLGNNQFTVWVSLTDYYDFAANLEYYTTCGLECQVANFLGLLNKAGINANFNVTIGFFHPYSWQPATPVSSEPADTTPAETVPAVQNVVDQYYARGNYDVGSYTGSWSNGKPNGYGTLIYNANTKYKITMNDGSIYTASQYSGNWRDGKKYGQGVFTFSNGAAYDGVWNVDGFYFKGYYVGNTRWKQYIEQVADGDNITNLRVGEIIYT